MGDVTEKSSETEQFTSMEQLWLAFVMKELHQKKREGDKWIDS